VAPDSLAHVDEPPREPPSLNRPEPHHPGPQPVNGIESTLYDWTMTHRHVVGSQEPAGSCSGSTLPNYALIDQERPSPSSCGRRFAPSSDSAPSALLKRGKCRWKPNAHHEARKGLRQILLVRTLKPQAGAFCGLRDHHQLRHDKDVPKAHN